MMRRPDWTVYHRMMRKLKGVGRAAIDAWTQGSLRTHTAGDRVVCPMCNVQVTMKHLIWECQYHEQPLPASWVQDIQANENTMLWSRGLIEVPDYRLPVGMDSLGVHGLFAHGWPIRVTPVQRLAIGVKPTCKEPRLRHFVVSLIGGAWQDGSWQLTGKCTCVVPGEANEARAWVFGCWLLLQATLGRHQVNVAHRAGWAAVTKGGRGTCAPDLWHSLPAEEWKRLKILHVPKKMLQQTGDDNRYIRKQPCVPIAGQLALPLMIWFSRRKLMTYGIKKSMRLRPSGSARSSLTRSTTCMAKLNLCLLRTRSSQRDREGASISSAS